MAEDFGVKVEGLPEFRRALRKLGKELPKELKQIMKAAAERGVSRARRLYEGQYPLQHSTRRSTGRTASKGIRVASSQTGAGIRFGGARYPYLLGQEFGSNKWPQFRPWTGPGPGGAGSMGRAIYPAARAEADAAAGQAVRGFDRLARRAFPDRL